MKNFGLVLVLIVLLGVLGLSVRSQRLGGDAGVSSYTKAITSTSVLVGATSVSVLATSTSRVYAEIANASTTAALYCNADNGKPATLHEGIYIAPSGKYVISPQNDNLYYGTVRCIAPAPSASTTVYQR